jgi:ABC-2 type transport system permease protein
MSEGAVTAQELRPAAERKAFIENSLVQLTLVRFREFWREPEAVFWVFVFPILLAGGLGIAFRNKPADIMKVAAVGPQLAAALRTDKTLAVEELDLTAGEQALRAGRIVLLAVPAANGGVTYRFDDTNPDGRTAKMLVNRAVQKAAGARDVVPAKDDYVREAGSRYIDFLVPGLVGTNLMGSGIWGIGFTIVDARRKKLLKRLIASPMPRWQYLLSFLLSRLSMLYVEIAAILGFGVFVFGVPVRGSLWELALLCLISAVSFSTLGLLVASRAKTMEAAYVDFLRRFLLCRSFPQCIPAVRESASADRRDRCHARQHAARRPYGPAWPAACGNHRLDDSMLLYGAAAVPLEVN